MEHPMEYPRADPAAGAPSALVVDTAMALIVTDSVEAAVRYMVEHNIPIPVISKLLDERKYGLSARDLGPTALAPHERAQPAESD